MSDLLKLEGTFNLRDLGGHSVGGVIMRKQIFIRAGNLDQLPLSSQEKLISYGVRTVIDLRDEWEVQRFPNVFATSDKVTYLNLPLIGDELSTSEVWKAESENYESLHELYIQYLDRRQTQIGTIIATLAESAPTTIFHCYAGKDRTGLIAALLLAAVGVSEDAIVADYAQSRSQILHLIEQWREYAVQHGKDMRRFEVEVDSAPTTMLSVLSYLKHKHGNVSGYLQACGVTANQLTQLKSRFIEVTA